jgi:hypothetical protein
MSSPFSSALTQLDANLQTIQSQLDGLRAGLDVDDNQLGRSLRDARQHAAIVRDLIRAERPDANWTDRRALDRLIHEVIATKARRNQQRRTKLLELANELEAGSVKHRRDSRTTELNTLRLEAVQELQTEAALAEQVKDLPGPNADEWLHWVCNLQEARDALVLTNLRRDFGAVERFAGEMEEMYWTPGQAAPHVPATCDTHLILNHIGQGGAGGPAAGEARLSSPPQTGTVHSPEATVVQPAEQASIDPSGSSLDTDFEELRATLAQRYSAALAAEAMPTFAELVLSKGYVAAWFAAAIQVFRRRLSRDPDF